MATATSAQFAYALEKAFRHVLQREPCQSLPSHVVLDALCMVVAGKLYDMARTSNLSPHQQEDFLATFEYNLRLATEAAFRLLNDPQ
jgi:hypothetical protein